ncbi:hypothetical protein AB6A40_007780 [Gnathostoma spinigerum]|uniref:ABC transporter domain-containing protein n=1 Tax=Gnathostoma spinigerum TaxID=75299 RepID=A0ABD6EUF4_9BILA
MNRALHCCIALKFCLVKVPSNVLGAIDFTCVSMRYGPSLPFAIENVTFHISGGSKVAIIGRTGSGKSSLIQALLCTNKIDSGHIFIDGHDVNLFELRSFRSLFGVVTQTPFLFSGTLRDNLTLGTVTSDEFFHVLMRTPDFAGAIERLGGLDRIIEESGANISLGEKQVVSICRMFLTSPKVVIFDEATAHVDFATHLKITNLIRQLLPRATLISILHRLEGIENYDEVIRMDSGRIVWRGCPREIGSLPSF